jgi:glutaredoxin
MPIQLYHRWQCPYSARVRDFIDENHLGPDIEYIEIEETDGADMKLQELTGRSQVPCLVVDGKPMLESAAIVQWLQDNLVKPKGTARL